MTPHTTWSLHAEMAAPPLDTTLRSLTRLLQPRIPQPGWGRPLGCAEMPATSARAPHPPGRGPRCGLCYLQPRTVTLPPQLSSCAFPSSQMPACPHCTESQNKRAGSGRTSLR